MFDTAVKQSGIDHGTLHNKCVSATMSAIPDDIYTMWISNNKHIFKPLEFF